MICICISPVFILNVCHRNLAPEARMIRAKNPLKNGTYSYNTHLHRGSHEGLKLID